MKKSSSLFFTLAIVFFCSTLVKAQKAINVNGLWKMKVETSMGSGSPTFDLKHASDSTLTGTYKGQLGEAPVKGTLKGKVIHLEFNISGNLVEYNGQVENETMKGSVKLGSMASGTFEGSKSK